MSFKSLAANPLLIATATHALYRTDPMITPRRHTQQCDLPKQTRSDNHTCKPDYYGSRTHGSIKVTLLLRIDTASQ